MLREPIPAPPPPFTPPQEHRRQGLIVVITKNLPSFFKYRGRCHRLGKRANRNSLWLFLKGRLLLQWVSTIFPFLSCQWLGMGFFFFSAEVVSSTDPIHSARMALGSLKTGASIIAGTKAALLKSTALISSGYYLGYGGHPNETDDTLQVGSSIRLCSQ